MNDTIFNSEYSGHYNDFIYDGVNVKIVKTNTYTYTFLCDYNWKDYPFDTQNCNMQLLIDPEKPMSKMIKVSFHLSFLYLI